MLLLFSDACPAFKRSCGRWNKRRQHQKQKEIIIKKKTSHTLSDAMFNFCSNLYFSLWSTNYRACFLTKWCSLTSVRTQNHLSIMIIIGVVSVAVIITFMMIMHTAHCTTARRQENRVESVLSALLCKVYWCTSWMSLLFSFFFLLSFAQRDSVLIYTSTVNTRHNEFNAKGWKEKRNIQINLWKKINNCGVHLIAHTSVSLNATGQLPICNYPCGQQEPATKGTNVKCLLFLTVMVGFCVWIFFSCSPSSSSFFSLRLSLVFLHKILLHVHSASSSRIFVAFVILAEPLLCEWAHVSMPSGCSSFRLRSFDNRHANTHKCHGSMAWKCRYVNFA